MLIDSHAHLDADGLRPDLDRVLESAHEAGVERILTIGCLREDSFDSEEFILKLIEEKPDIVAAFGVHPHDAQHWSEAIEKRLSELMSHPKVVALGEVGLDFYYENAPPEVQEGTFRAQIDLARALRKPIIIHSREAEKETCEILEAAYSNSGDENPGVLHSFTGGEEMARECLELDFYFGVGGIFTFKNSANLRKVIETLPLERLLVETDSPYLAPIPHRGKKNQPAFVRIIAEALAHARRCALSEIAAQTSLNFDHLFRRSHS